MQLVRYHHPEHGVRIGVLNDDETAVMPLGGEVPSIAHVLSAAQTPIDLLSAAPRDVAALPIADFADAPDSTRLHFLAPCDEQDVWAAGVTYERSREARQEESADGGDIYARVYAAERPELFYKARGRDVVAPGGAVGIRRDATWSVPEPELVLVINTAMDVIGFTVGNDMSSRDIEGENPLYLPQAKVYTASCAMARGIVLLPTIAHEWPITTIRIQIERAETIAFSGEVSTARIKRTLPELVEHLGRSYSFSHGVFLFTGTGVVPAADFTLQADDVITITIDGIGTLTNPVKVV